jgi:hypothetical protein
MAVVEHVHAILAVLVELYQSQDRAPLMLAAARQTALQRLRVCAHRSLIPHWRIQQDAHRELTEAQRLAEQLQALSPLPLLHSPSPCRRRVHADPDVYVSADDDGDWLTCPRCDTPTVLISPGAGLGGLLHAHAQHRCSLRSA